VSSPRCEEEGQCHRLVVRREDGVTTVVGRREDGVPTVVGRRGGKRVPTIPPGVERDSIPALYTTLLYHPGYTSLLTTWSTQHWLPGQHRCGWRAGSLGSVPKNSLGARRRGGLWAQSREEQRRLCAEFSQIFRTDRRKDRIDGG